MIRNLVCFAIIIFNIFDCYSTGIILSMGLGYEANPIAAHVIEYMGVWAAVPKLLVAIPTALVLRHYWSISKILRALACFVALEYTALAAYQVYMMANLFIFGG